MPQVDFPTTVLGRDAISEEALGGEGGGSEETVLALRALDSPLDRTRQARRSPLACPVYIAGQSNPRARELSDDAVNGLRVLIDRHWQRAGAHALGTDEIGRLLGEALLTPRSGDPRTVADVARALSEEIDALARRQPDGYLLYEVLPAFAQVAEEKFGHCFRAPRHTPLVLVDDHGVPQVHVNNLEHLLAGFAEGIADSGVMSPSTALSLFNKYLQSMLTWNVLAPTIMHCGMGYGLVERFAADVQGLLELIGVILDQQQLEQLIEGMMTILFDPAAAQQAHEMGHMLATAFLQPVIDLTKTDSSFWFLWQLGKLLGPIFFDVVLMLLGVGEVTFVKNLLTGPVGVTSISRLFTRHVARVAPQVARRIPEPVDVFRTSMRQVEEVADLFELPRLPERLRSREMHSLADEIAVAFDDDVADLEDSLKIINELSDKELRGLAEYHRVFEGQGRWEKTYTRYLNGKGTPGGRGVFGNPNVRIKYGKDAAGNSTQRATNAGGANFNWHNLLTGFPPEFSRILLEVLSDLGPNMVDDSLRFPLDSIMRGGYEAQGAWGSLLAARRQLETQPGLLFRFEVPDQVVVSTTRNVEYDFVAYRVRSDADERALAALSQVDDPRAWENSPLVDVEIRAEVKDYHKSRIHKGGRIRDQMKRYLMDSIEHGDVDFKHFAYFVPESNSANLRPDIENELRLAFEHEDIRIAVEADPDLDLDELRVALHAEIATGRMVRTYGYDPSSVSPPPTPPEP